MRFVIQVALGICAAAVAACGANDVPVSVPVVPVDTAGHTGMYHLTAISGVPIPWIYSSNASSRTMLDSARLDFERNGAFLDVRWQRRIALGFELAEIPTLVGRYAVIGDRVVLYYLGADGLSLLRTDTAVFSGSSGITKVEGSASLMFAR